MEDVKDQGDEELYAKLDAAYSSDEEDMEVSTMNYQGHNKKILYVESYWVLEIFFFPLCYHGSALVWVVLIFKEHTEIGRGEAGHDSHLWKIIISMCQPLKTTGMEAMQWQIYV